MGSRVSSTEGRRGATQGRAAVGMGGRQREFWKGGAAGEKGAVSVLPGWGP